MSTADTKSRLATHRVHYDRVVVIAKCRELLEVNNRAERWDIWEAHADALETCIEDANASGLGAVKHTAAGALMARCSHRDCAYARPWQPISCFMPWHPSKQELAETAIEAYIAAEPDCEKLKKLRDTLPRACVFCRSSAAKRQMANRRQQGGKERSDASGRADGG